MIDVIIIGSGISGCFLAKKLHEKNLNVLIIEKSKSLGGRFSTKPVGSGLADYGCQYISPKSEILKQLMENLFRKKLVTYIEIEKNKKVYICPYGLNKIPFYLSLGISSVTNQKVYQLVRKTNHWEIKTNLQSFHSKTVILSCPAIQSQEILDKSDINHIKLPNTSYNSFYSLTFSVSKKLNDKIFYFKRDYPWICNNKDKGLLNNDLIYTVNASEKKSQELFIMKNNDRKKIIFSDMNDIGFSNINNMNIHFWKFGFANEQNNANYIYDKKFKLGLCGDSFSIGRVDGSVISANELSKKIK